MSNGPNHRRGEKHRQDNGPRWENSEPNHGGAHCARARRGWRTIGRRVERRTGEKCGSVIYLSRRGRDLPVIDPYDSRPEQASRESRARDPKAHKGVRLRFRTAVRATGYKGKIVTDILRGPVLYAEVDSEVYEELSEMFATFEGYPVNMAIG